MVVDWWNRNQGVKKRTRKRSARQSAFDCYQPPALSLPLRKERKREKKCVCVRVSTALLFLFLLCKFPPCLLLYTPSFLPFLSFLSKCAYINTNSDWNENKRSRVFLRWLTRMLLCVVLFCCFCACFFNLLLFNLFRFF